MIDLPVMLYYMAILIIRYTMIPFNKLGWAFHRFGKRIYPQEVRQNLCYFLDTLPPEAKVLDVGAGTGVLCELSLACRDDLVLSAADPAEGMLQYCRESVHTVVAPAETLPFDNNSFDGVLMGEALHHFRNVDAALLEIKRILKPNGMLFIYDFNPKKFKGAFIAKSEILLGEPGNFFVPSELAEKLSSFGFQATIQQYGYRYTVHAKKGK